MATGTTFSVIHGPAANRLRRLATYASVSVAALLIAVKFAAWLETGSVALLSSLVDSLLDAAASLVNLVAVRHAMSPADREHRFGHGKAEPLAVLGQSAFITGSAMLLLAEAVRRLINEAFVAERALKKGGIDRLPVGDGELDHLLERGTFLLLEEDEAIVACVYVEPRGESAYLGLLSIAPERQRMGLGKKMNEAAEDFARKQGCRWMDLRVVSPRRDRLVPVYLRLGYAEQGTEEYPAEVRRRAFLWLSPDDVYLRV